MPFVPDAQTSSFVPDKKKGAGFLSNVFKSSASSAAKRFARVADNWKSDTFRGGENEIHPLERSLRTVGQGAGLVGDVTASAVIEGAKAILPESAEKKTAEVGLALLQSPAGKAALGAVSEGAEAYGQWKEKNPRIAENLEAVLNIASLLPIGKAGSAGTEVAETAAKAGTKAVKTGTTLAKEVAETAAKAGTKAVKTGTTLAKEVAETAAKAGTKAVKSRIPDSVDDVLKTAIPAGKETFRQIGQKISNTANRAAEAADRAAEISKLPQAQQAAIRTGIPESMIGRALTTVPETKPYMKRMVYIAKRGVDDFRFESRPVEVAGERLTEAASFVAKSMKSTGKALGEVKKTLRGKMVDIPEIRKELLNDLDDLGLKIGKGGKLVSDVPVNDDVLEVLTDIQKFIGWKKKTVGKVDAVNLDRLRSYLFKAYSKTGVPLQGQAQSIVGKYREKLLETLNGLDENYGRLAREYATKHDALEDFTKLLQYKGSLEDLSKKTLKAGEVAFRVLGNAADRPRSVIDKVLSVAKKAGFDQKEDVYDLIRFADELESITGSMPRSLPGNLERAGESVLGKIPVIGGLLEGAAQAGKPTPKQMLEALEKLFD